MTSRRIALAPDFGIFVIGGRQDSSMEVRRLDDGEVLGRFHGQHFVVDFWFTPDEELLAIAREDGIVELWRLPSEAGRQPPERVTQHTLDGGRIECVEFFPDGHQLLIGSADGPIRLCRLLRDADRPRILESIALERPPGSVNAIRVAPDGKTVVAVGSVPDGPGGWLATWYAGRDE